MERKNYLVEKLCKEERNYIYTIIVNERNRFIKNNCYNTHISYCAEEVENNEEDSVLDTVISRCESEITAAVEFEKVIEDEKLYKIIKALSLREKMVLFYLFKEQISVEQTAKKLGLDKVTIYRIKDRVIDKILKHFLGGNNND